MAFHSNSIEQLEDVWELDRLCDEFETSLRNGNSPDIASFLSSVAPERQSHLTDDLLRIEIEHRRHAGEELEPEGFFKRLPAHLHSTIEKVFNSTASPPPVIVDVAWTSDDDDQPIDLSGFTIERKLATGGMGVVWQARDHRMQRTLAIKVMKHEAARSTSIKQRFLQEAQICAQLTHPNIVPIHEVGELSDGRCWYSMKLVAGQTLADVLRDKNREQELFELLRVFLYVAQAIGFAHSKKVIHRDLKPLNIMIGRHAEVQVMDWGLARALNRPDGFESTVGSAGQTSFVDSHMDVLGQEFQDSVVRVNESVSRQETRFGDVFGTFAYMPPEQARGLANEIDKRSDVFALGAILCEILTGQPPYSSEDAGTTKLNAVNAALTAAFDRLDRSGADPALIQICRNCLALRKSERPSDGQTLATMIETHLNSIDQKLQQERIDRQREQIEAKSHRERIELTARWAKLRSRLFAALAAVAVAAGGLGYHSIQQQNTINVANIEAEHQRQQREARIDADCQAIKTAVLAASETLRRGHFSAAQAELNKGAKLIGNVDEKSRATYANLWSAVNLGLALDQARLDYFTWNDGWFDCATALDRYATVFSDNGFPMLDGSVDKLDDPKNVAELVASSRCATRIIAAIDDWAWLAHRELQRSSNAADVRHFRQLRDRLLHIAAIADPDEFRNLVRTPQTWDDARVLSEIAGKLEADQVSPEFAVLIGTLLPPDDRPNYFRRCYVAHPGDFWLNVELGRSLLREVTIHVETGRSFATLPMDTAVAADDLSSASQALAAEAAGYYRAALAVHPQNIGVHIDLAACLFLTGQRTESISICRSATQMDSQNATKSEVASAWYALGLLIDHDGQHEAAVEALETARQLDPQSQEIRIALAGGLRNAGRRSEASAQLKEMLDEATDDAARRELCRLTLDCLETSPPSPENGVTE